MHLVLLRGEGEVLSFTTLRSPPEGFAAPLHLALVLIDNAAIVLCHADSATAARVNIGDHVLVRLDETGLFHYSLQY